MWPLVLDWIMRVAACLEQRKTLVRFVSISLCHCSLVMSMTSDFRPQPALFIRMSTVPNFSQVRSKRFDTASGSVTSVFTKMQFWLKERMLCCNSISLSSLLAARTILDPLRANARAVALPMPLLAPVITTTFSFKFAIAVHPFNCVCYGPVEIELPLPV